MFLRICVYYAADWVAFQIEATPSRDHASNLGFNKPPSGFGLGYAKIDNRIGAFRRFQNQHLKNGGFFGKTFLKVIRKLKWNMYFAHQKHEHHHTSLS
jgi:hypothetical protein